ncbi:MAG: EAL domain-containing response regulator [Pseudomonadota bacterium]
MHHPDEVIDQPGENLYPQERAKAGSALVVEDDARLAQIVAKTLRFCGYENVVIMSRCGNAVAALDAATTPFDLIVSDLVLPDSDGFMLVSHLAETGFRGQLILISGNESRLLSTAASQAQAGNLNLLGTLNKPFSLHRVISLLESQGEGARDSAGATPFSFELSDFQRALEDGQIVAHFHPIVDVRTRQMVGIEALARWEHPDLGIIPPFQFMPKVEMSELSDAFLIEMLRQSLTTQAHLSDLGFDVAAAVNVGSGQLTSLALTNRILELMRGFSARPENVVLEVTETQGFGEPRAAIETLNRLRLHGFRLAVDDYGTGFSSLERLRTLPFTELKVDRQFVAGAADSAELAAILSHCVALAKQFDLTTVAEGIETVEDWHAVRKLGFTAAQGFFFSRPLTADELPMWARRRLVSAGEVAAQGWDTAQFARQKM